MKRLLWILSFACFAAAASGSVVMSHFEGIPTNNRVSLQWGTISENENYFFEVWRDTVIQIQMAGHGTTQDPHEYSWVDDNAVNETRYMYRLFVSAMPRDSVAGADIRPPHWVTLNTYHISAGDHQVAINWNTAAEIYSVRFDCYRNGAAIASIPGQGHTNRPHNYYYADFDAINGVQYTYTLWAVDINSRRDSLFSGTVTPVDAEISPAPVAREFSVNAYPNPFNPSTTLSFVLPREGRVDIGIFDITGSKVQSFTSDILPAGNHQFIFDGSSLPTGVYFAQLQSGAQVRVQKLMLLK